MKKYFLYSAKDLVKKSSLFFICSFIFVSISIKFDFFIGMLKKLLFEQYTPNTIAILLEVVVILSSINLLLFGKYVPNSKYSFLHEKIISPLINLGKSFLSIFIGLVSGGFVSTLIFADNVIIFLPMLIIISHSALWFIFDIVRYLNENNLPESISNIRKRIILFLAIIIMSFTILYSDNNPTQDKNPSINNTICIKQ